MIPAPDLFTHAGLSSPLPTSLECGLDDWARKPPLWPVSPGTWHAIVADVRRLADRWHHAAIAQRWTVDQLYALHADAPFTRLDAMGAFWIAARRRDQVTAVDHIAITLKTRSGAVLRIYRR